MRRLRAVLCALLSAAAIGAGLVSAGQPAIAAPATDTLSWGDCPAGSIPPPVQGLPRAADLKCAALSVPLDYRDPHGRHITVEVSLLASRNPAARRGELLLNPGGPGGSGLPLPVEIGTVGPQPLIDAYDLIGFDPRGIGASTPVTCDMTVAQEQEVLSWPLVPGGVPANAAVDKQIAEQCQAASGSLLPYITTANTARDMDRIRIALGERRISYDGVSYGSYLGAVYATLFPGNTDRVVLDSNVDPTKVWREVFREWGPGTEIRFPDFENWLAARAAQYGLGDTPEKVRATYFALAAKLDRTPLNGLTGNLFRAFTRGSMYNDASFPQLAAVWQQVAVGAATAAVAASAAPTDNPFAALLAVICGDTTWPRSVPRYEADVAHDSRLYPIAGALAADVTPCAFWPTRPVEPVVPISSYGPRNILLLNNLRDPATPYAGALNMRRALGSRASLVTVDAGGHGVFLFGANPCAADVATQWLVAGKLPGDTFCGASAAPRSQLAIPLSPSQLF